MALRRRLVMAAVVLVGALERRPAEARGPSTPEERAKVVALTRMLELDPLAEDAPAARDWLRAWAIEVPDLRVYACPQLLSHVLGGRVRDPAPGRGKG